MVTGWETVPVETLNAIAGPAVSEGRAQKLPPDNYFVRAATLPSAQEFLLAVQKIAQTSATTPTPPKAQEYPEGRRPLRAAFEKYGARGVVEKAAYIPAAGALFVAGKTYGYELLYQYGLELAPWCIDCIAATLTGALITGIGFAKTLPKQAAKERGDESVLNALRHAVAKNPALMTLGISSLGLATFAASQGIGKSVVTTERMGTFGEQTKKELAPFEKQVIEAQPAVRNFVTDLRRRIDFVLAAEKDLAAAQRRIPSWRGRALNKRAVL